MQGTRLLKGLLNWRKENQLPVLELLWRDISLLRRFFLNTLTKPMMEAGLCSQVPIRIVHTPLHHVETCPFNCSLMCCNCGVCIYMFCCTCTDALVRDTICRHIHLVIRSEGTGKHEVIQPNHSENAPTSSIQNKARLGGLDKLLSKVSEISAGIHDLHDVDTLSAITLIRVSVYWQEEPHPESHPTSIYCNKDHFILQRWRSHDQGHDWQSLLTKRNKLPQKFAKIWFSSKVTPRHTAVNHMWVDSSFCGLHLCTNVLYLFSLDQLMLLWHKAVRVW